MTPAESGTCHDRLLTLRDELLALEVTSAEGVQTVELDQSSTGRLTRMDAMQAQQMNLAGQSRRLQQLHQIELALARLERGEYGRCLACDEWINPRRLDLDPSLDLCVSCAE